MPEPVQHLRCDDAIIGDLTRAETTRVDPKILCLLEFRPQLGLNGPAIGAGPKVVSERRGHSSIGITLDTDSHVLPGMQEEAAEAFDALFPAAMSEGADRVTA